VQQYPLFFNAQIGIAENKFIAYLAASHSTPAATKNSPVIPTLFSKI